MLGAQSKPQKVPEIIWRKEDQKVLAFAPQEGKIYVLNPTAARAWELADGTLTIAQITDRIAMEFSEARKENVSTDLLELFGKLTEKQFVKS